MISSLTTTEERDCKSDLDKNVVWKPRDTTLLQSNKIYSSIMGAIDTGTMEEVNEYQELSWTVMPTYQRLDRMHTSYQ